MVLAWQPVEGQRLVYIVFDPAGELRILRRPLGEPGGQIAARLDEIAPIPRVRLRRPEDRLPASAAPAGNRCRPPLSRGQALAWHVVERVAQKMHIAALIGCRLRRRSIGSPPGHLPVRDSGICGRRFTPRSATTRRALRTSRWRAATADRRDLASARRSTADPCLEARRPHAASSWSRASGHAWRSLLHDRHRRRSETDCPTCCRVRYRSRHHACRPRAWLRTLHI